MNISGIINFFIHPSYLTNNGILWRVRLFVWVCLISLIFLSFYSWFSYYIEFYIAVYILLIYLVCVLLLALLVRTQLSFIWLENTYVLLGSIMLTILTYYSGGLWSAVYPWLIIIPIVALLVINKLSGVIWGIISLGLMFWFAIIAYQGIELPVAFNTTLRTLWYIIVLPGALVVLLIFSFVFKTIEVNILKKLEAKNKILKIKNETIALRTNDLKKLLKEKENLIHLLVHDIRGPLSNISNMTSLVEIAKNKADREHYLTFIKKSAIKAHNLVEHVLESDSLQPGSKKEPVHTDLSATVAEVVENMAGNAKMKGLEIILNNKASNTIVIADKIYLSLVFENLLSNALKFSNKGKKIILDISNHNSSVRAKVIDEGPGILPGEEDMLFNKFTKLNARPTGGESSTGLGLSLVKQYVEMFEGRVWYERPEKKGAAFVVEFPLAGASV